jgi:hypothetical protein
MQDDVTACAARADLTAPECLRVAALIPVACTSVLLRTWEAVQEADLCASLPRLVTADGDVAKSLRCIVEQSEALSVAVGPLLNMLSVHALHPFVCGTAAPNAMAVADATAGAAAATERRVRHATIAAYAVLACLVGVRLWGRRTASSDGGWGEETRLSLPGT